MGQQCASFRERLASGTPLIGTFLKTPSAITAEVLGLTTLDIVCIDTEHAPFGHLEMDQCVAALRAADCPTLVRVRDDSSTSIRNALDCGATGILVPHVTSADQAAAIVKAAHFGEGGRGFAGSTRAAGYTRKPMQTHLTESAEQTTVVVQIEDLAALGSVADIAAVPGVNAIFVGRVDLAVAMGHAPMDSEVVDVVKQICGDAKETGTAVGMFTPDSSEIPMWRSCGASFYLLSSDQSMLIAGANSLAGIFG